MTATLWETETIAELLGVELTKAKASTKAKAERQSDDETEIEAEPAPDPLPKWVRAARDNPDTEDRSKALARLVSACLDSHLTLGQTLTVCRGYGPAVEKYGDRLAAEVDRAWTKFSEDRDVRQGQDDEPAQDEQGEGPPVSSWSPVDLTDFINGTHVPPTAGLLFRTDGVGMLYPGRVHWFHGESESGKSWVSQITTVEVLGVGGRVLYLDFESTPDEIVARLLLLGASPEAITERFVYVQPGIASDRDPRAFSELLKVAYDLAVVDGVTEALGLYGASSIDADDVTAWGRKLPRRIARETGAAVACVDHVTKSEEGRGRFAFGSQAKLSLLDGCAYLVEPKEIAPGQCGTLILRVGKDRAGQVRKNCGTHRASDRTQEAARIRFDSTDPKRIKYAVEPYASHVDPETGESTFRPTYLMERASRYVEQHPDKSTREITSEVSGNKQALGTALEILVQEGYLSSEEYTVRGGTGKKYRSLRPYRESEDPQSDKFQGSSEGCDPVPGPKDQGTRNPGHLEHPSDPVPDPGRNRVEPGSDQGKQVGTGSASKGSSQDQEPGRNRVDDTRSNKDQHQRRVIGVSEIISEHRQAPSCAGVESGPCARCQRHAERLILGRCARCAYPAGGGPDEDEADEATTNGTVRPDFMGWLLRHRADYRSLGGLITSDYTAARYLSTWAAVEQRLKNTGASQKTLNDAYEAWNAYQREAAS